MKELNLTNNKRLNVSGPRNRAFPPKPQKKFSRLLPSLLIGVLSLFGVLWIFERAGGFRSSTTLSSWVRSVFQRNDIQNQTLEICVKDDLSDAVLADVTDWVKKFEKDEAHEGSNVFIKKYSGTHPESCSVVVSTKDEGNFDLVWEKYFALVGSVSTAHKIQNITKEEVLRLLGDGMVEIGGTGYSVVVDSESAEELDRAVGVGVRVETSTDVVASVSGNALHLGVLPFDVMTYTVGEISIDGESLRAGTVSSEYPLATRLWIDTREFPELFDVLQRHLGSSGYNSSLVKTVVVTGTSVVGARGWFATSTANGDWLYPIRNVGDILREASIAHISNEGSRLDGCEQHSWTLAFCGPPEAYDALTWAGIDVVGLTGNHILDYGRDAFNSTLDWYDNSGIKYFGGGRNLASARQGAIIDLGSVTVAFLGYNMIPPASYSATETGPGSVPLEEVALRADIASAKERADFVFVDMQWGNEYEREPNGYQTTFGRIAVDSGATIVSGVHPHWIQPLEFYNGGLIFYSLGNFLFDQTWSLETREGVMVRHYFYGAKYLGFEIIPTIIDDEKQVDPAEGADRERIIGYVIAG